MADCFVKYIYIHEANDPTGTFCMYHLLKILTRRADRKEEQPQEHHSYSVDQKHMVLIDPHTEVSLSHQDNAPFVHIVCGMCVYIASISKCILLLNSPSVVSVAISDLENWKIAAFIVELKMDQNVPRVRYMLKCNHSVFK